MYLPDFLSRPNSDRLTDEVMNDCKAAETFVASVVEDALIDSS